MKTILCNIGFLLITVTGLSQNTENSYLKGASYDTGFYQLEKLKGKTGFSGTLQITIPVNEHLISSCLSVGYGILSDAKDNVLKNSIHLFSELDLLYGRSFRIIENVDFRLFSGIGITAQSKLKNQDEVFSLTIPVRAKLLYHISQNFSIGIVSHINFNAINDIYMYQLALQFSW